MPFLNKKLDAKRDRRIRPDGDWANYKRNNKKSGGECEGLGEKLIEVTGVTLSYDGRDVVRDVSFEVCAGDYICIVGENGSGKSTLTDALLGLKKVDMGKITFLSGASRSDVGFLPQKTEVQRDFPATVREIVMSGCCDRGKMFFSRKDKQRAFDNMEKLGITHLSRSSFRALSGGQQQRVLLSRALCAAKRVLVLDEPVTGLDVRSTQDMYTLIESMNKDEGMAVLMITHDMQAAVRYSSHILYLGNKKSFFGEKMDVIRHFPEIFGEADADTDASYGDSNAYRYGGKI